MGVVGGDLAGGAPVVAGNCGVAEACALVRNAGRPVSPEAHPGTTPWPSMFISVAPPPPILFHEVRGLMGGGGGAGYQ